MNAVRNGDAGAWRWDIIGVASCAVAGVDGRSNEHLVRSNAFMGSWVSLLLLLLNKTERASEVKKLWSLLEPGDGSSVELSKLV